MDEGWMPEAETKARARATAYDPNAARSKTKARPGGRESEPAAGGWRRSEGEVNEVYRARFRRCWDVWCRLWMAGLNVGVPVASAYFVAVGLMHGRLPLFR